MAASTEQSCHAHSVFPERRGAIVRFMTEKETDGPVRESQVQLLHVAWPVKQGAGCSGCPSLAATPFSLTRVSAAHLKGALCCGCSKRPVTTLNLPDASRSAMYSPFCLATCIAQQALVSKHGRIGRAYSRMFRFSRRQQACPGRDFHEISSRCTQKYSLIV